MNDEIELDSYQRPALGTPVTVIRTQGGLYGILESTWWAKVCVFREGGVPAHLVPVWAPLVRLSIDRSKRSDEVESDATQVLLSGPSEVQPGDPLVLEGEGWTDWVITTPVLDVIHGEVAAKLTPDDVHIVYHPYAAWRVTGDDTNAAIPLLKLGDDGPPEQVDIREVTAYTGTIVRIKEAD